MDLQRIIQETLKSTIDHLVVAYKTRLSVTVEILVQDKVVHTFTSWATHLPHRGDALKIEGKGLFRITQVTHLPTSSETSSPVVQLTVE